MNRIFYNTFIFALALLFGGIVVIATIRPSESKQSFTSSGNTITWSTVTLANSEKAKVNAKIIDPKNAKVSADTPMLVDFGRLSSFLYLAPAGNQADVLTQKSSTGIILGKVSGIVSLYDLFLSYTIFDVDNTFRLEQITNGSVYIGKEADEKIAIYAIDGVMRLIFMDDNKDMTSMVLFPGSYIRFDPSRNGSLKNADLFRTILSLKDSDNEVFEFVNPRVNVGDEQDIFFNYRLSQKSRILFRILSARFKEKVEQIDLTKQYAQYAYNPYQEENSWLKNPTKKNHNMLLELSSLLAKAVSMNSDPDTLVGKIGRLYNEAKGLNLQSSTAKTLVEQFLLDGRFAMYAGVSNVKYQTTYESIAKIIGIEPTSANSQLLQDLANIYSKNLFTQKKVSPGLKIDTYSPTATKLIETLEQNEIDQKDNFDIAIYAFNILKKMEVKPGEMTGDAMEDVSSYNYFLTFFRASNRYISSIDDETFKQKTIMGFSRQFYDPMLTTIVNSLYKNFATVEDGAVYVVPRYRAGLIVTIPTELTLAIMNLSATVENMAPSIESLWESAGNTDTYIHNRIHENLLRLKAFRTMIDSDSYNSYIDSPYQAQSGSLYPFPEIDKETDSVLRFDTKKIEQIKSIKALSTDPRIGDLKKIWPDADASSWMVDGDDIRVIKAPYKISRDGEGNSKIAISAIYSEKTFSDIMIHYGENNIRIKSNIPMTTQVYYSFMAKLQYYLDVVDKEIANGMTDLGEIVIFPGNERINIKSSLYSVSIPEEIN